MGELNRDKIDRALLGTCEVCGKNAAIRVACVPGVPYSAAYCQACLDANAHPLSALIANTVCCGGLDKCADWWQEMVLHSLEYIGRKWFEGEVKKRLDFIAGVQS